MPTPTLNSSVLATPSFSLSRFGPNTSAALQAGQGIQIQPTPLTCPSGNALTTLEIGLANLLLTGIAQGGGGFIFTPAQIELDLLNTSGQTITAASLILTNEDAGYVHTNPITVAAQNFPSGGIASSAPSVPLTFNLTGGQKTYAVLVLTMAGAPVTGAVQVEQVNLSPRSGAGVQLMGSYLQEAILSVPTLALSATSAYSSVLDFHATYVKGLMFTIAGTFAATAATTGLQLQVFYSPDNVNWDTDTYATFQPTVVASDASAQTVQKSRPVTIIPGYYRANVVNLDGTNAATGVKVSISEVA